MSGNLEFIVAEAWQLAAHRPVFNAISCVTGGLRLQDWEPLRAQVRALVSAAVTR